MTDIARPSTPNATPSKQTAVRHAVEGSAGEGFGKEIEKFAGDIGAVGGVAVGLAGKGFVKGGAGSAAAFGALVEKPGEDAGEDEKLVARGHFEMEAEHAARGLDDEDEIDGVGDPAGHRSGTVISVISVWIPATIA